MKNAFTLIEVLVVVCIIGIIAVIALTALKPKEQINRADDVATLEVASEVDRALTRYLSQKSVSPIETEMWGEKLNEEKG